MSKTALKTVALEVISLSFWYVQIFRQAVNFSIYLYMDCQFKFLCRDLTEGLLYNFI